MNHPFGPYIPTVYNVAENREHRAVKGPHTQPQELLPTLAKLTEKIAQIRTLDP